MKRLFKLKMGEMIKEVKYLNLTAGKGFYASRNNKYYIFSAWHNGKTLKDYTPSELKLIPIEKRMKCLQFALTKLLFLHNRQRRHGDIKPSNLLLNVMTDEMNLIDFGMSHKANPEKSFRLLKYTETPHFYDLCADVYSMGICTAFLFPELCQIDLIEGRCHLVPNDQTNLSPLEQAVVNLVEAMTYGERNKRCTTANALHYCQQLLENSKNLDEDLLSKISNSSIYRSNLTAEDVTAGKQAPLSRVGLKK